MSPPHYEYDKAFLGAAHGSMDIGSSIGQGEKFSTEPITDMKLGTSGRLIKKLYTSVAVLVLTQRPLVPSFTSVVG